jgi:arylsulfatase A-like enzyme
VSVGADGAASARPNVLFITLDQFRGDCLSSAGHPVVRTPNLDRLAAAGVSLRRHYSQAAPCAPGRAALYTGMYQMNNRVVANGTPLDDRLDNIARIARRAGYDPTLFGYTDQGVDPRVVTDPADPRRSTAWGILPGLTVEVDLSGPYTPWIQWLRAHGHDVPDDDQAVLRSEPLRPAEHSTSAFLTERLLAWIDRQEEPWFAHASFLRPHPPYAAAGAWAHEYSSDDVGDPIVPVPSAERHPLHEGLLHHPALAAPDDPRLMRELRAQYFGMIGEVDSQLGRVWDALRTSGAWEDTVIVVTADHGEQLGDHGLVQKAGFFESSYHVVGIVRDPHLPAGHGTVVERFTENVDIVPTVCEAIGVEVPLQCDGLPLTPFLRGEEPPWWRDAAAWEFDWRSTNIAHGPHPWPWDQRLEGQHLTVRRSDRLAYVQFGDGSWRCFDVAADPTWRTEVTDAALVLPEAQGMLLWRSRHAERTLTDMVLDGGGIGRWAPWVSSRDVL